MRKSNQIVTTLMLTLLLTFSGGAMAQTTYLFRYVSTEGDFNNDGESWATAKSNLQSAIDELQELIGDDESKVGYVYVQGSEAGMKYVPTSRSTSDADGSVFNTSFRIFGGIHVFGGFNGDEMADAETDEATGKYTEDLLWKKRIMTNGETYAKVESDINADLIGQTVRRWNFKYRTILSGNHSTTPYSFIFDTYRGIYNTSFPLSSYHVVWFATNGMVGGSDGSGLDPDENDLGGHFNPLNREATVEGCTIEGGYASNTNLHGHPHTGYGGGVYMVKNAVLRNCIVHHCAAAMRGGAVYMDGGGEVERCYIHTSQVTGYGMQQGYGGAVCIDYDGALEHSYIIQCAARIGAGLAICHVPHEYPEKTLYPNEEDRSDMYNPYALSTVIANCTSNAEGAGVYLDVGGTLNHCTVVNNKCVGPDVIYYGRRHGRTGGIYVRNGGTIYNTVAWGNESAVNNNVQYASFKDATSNNEISVHHSAFSKMDLTDWSSTSREVIVSLTNQNFPTADFHEGNFPMFSQPTAAAGIQYDPVTKTVNPEATASGQPYQRVYNWHPLSASGLRMKAVQVTDALQAVADEVIHAHTDVDVVGRAFEPVSSIGGLARSYRNLQWVLAPSQEYGEGATLIPTIFMDPERVVYDAENTPTSCGYLEDEPAGNSWEHPCGNLSDAITFFKNFLHEGGNEASTYYDLEGTHYQHVQIVVKQGSMIAAGQGAYLSGHARTASIRPSSNMRLYGGYSSQLTGTDMSQRSPHHYRTSLSANVLSGDYHNNSVHIIAIANQHNVIVDGFHLYSGNANVADPDFVVDKEQAKNYDVLSFGGGVVVNNAMAADNKRIDMVGNVLRNAVIANCSAPEGSAIYVSGGYRHGTEDRLCKAELVVVNTVIRNNTAGPAYGDLHKFDEENPDGIDSEWGTVVANGDAHIWLRNCNIVNNCGYALKANVPEGSTQRGHIEIYNSILFSNGQRIRHDRSNIAQAVSCKWDEDGAITGNYIYLDHDAVKPAMPEFIKCFNYLTRSKTEDGKPGLAWHVDSPGDAGSLSESVTLRYPWFVNPSRNVGHSEGEDFPMYGGVINYEPLPTNPIVNGAYPENMDSGNGFLASHSDEFSEANVLAKSASMSYDRELTPRTYGGAPDAGAVECTRLPQGGTVLYVTPDGAGRRDGSSWGNAIAGNTVYVLDNVSGPGLAPGDQRDPVTTCDRILNSEGNPVLTTDEKYCGGFGRMWFTDKKEGGTSNTVITKVWVTEKNVYSGGDRNGEEEIIKDGTTPEETSETTIMSPGTTKTGFTPGYDYDSRYPYGEISGSSRTFWRANPYEGTASSYASANAFFTAVNTNGYIKNTREERYVGGLQYAVEKAAAYNSLPENDDGRIDGVNNIQVWISNGKYTDYKGFVMRDKTTVLGSFPAKDGGTPGLGERHALMSAIADIPKPLAVQDLNSEEYETILQISDENPKKGNEVLNEGAVKFWDDDWSLTELTDNRSYAYKKKTIINTLTCQFSENDNTSKYLNYPDMPNLSRSGPAGNYSYGTTSDTKDCWHVSYPTSQTYYNVDISRQNVDLHVFDYDTGVAIETARYAWYRIGNGSLTGLRMWQTMKNVEDGTHKLTLDMMGGYRNGDPFDVTTPSNIYLYILDANGVELVAPVLLKCRDYSSPTGTNKNNVRVTAFRKTIQFTTATTGDVTIMVKVLDGTRNTTARNATYGTDDGRDPDPIPWEYLYDSGTIDKPGNNWGTNNPNRREFFITNLKLKTVDKNPSYVLTSQSVDEIDADVDDPKGPEVVSLSSYTRVTHRTTLRKRVLSMPDVCVPTYGGGGIGDPTNSNVTFGSDVLPHTDRVWGPTKSLRKATKWTKYEDPHYVEYSDAVWNGFTIRHGFLYDEAMVHGGGAGVILYEGAHLQDCIVLNNFAGASHNKGGGVFCDGAKSTVEGCFILDNTSTRGTNMTEGQIFAGGLFLYEGTCYNTLIANNYARGFGGGLGLCVGNFFNNTVAYNTSGHSSAPNGGLRIATGAKSAIMMANTIIYGNNGNAITMTETSGFAPFMHCYIQSTTKITSADITKAIEAHSESNDGKYGQSNTFLNGEPPSETSSPFEADVEGGFYTGGAQTQNDFRLRQTFDHCINRGTEDFESVTYQGYWHKLYANKTTLSSSEINSIKNQAGYQAALTAVLPNTDVAFTDRVKDCQIDIGAYEYDGTIAIEPTLYPDKKEAVFYVTENGKGMATATNPENAACYLKFQKVLDAAGRWRFASYFYADDTKTRTNFDEATLRKEIGLAGLVGSEVDDELLNLKDYKVIIKLEGDNGSHFSYIPTRSSRTSDNESPNDLEMSLIVPHGIQIEGGYEAEFTADRDPLGRPTLFNGEIHNSTLGTTGNVYHVVTFTDDLFGLDEHLYMDGDEQAQGQLTFLADANTWLPDGTDAEKTAWVNGNRTVLDGLFIENGYANGVVGEEKRGAAAVVTNFAHIRNCVIRNNRAMGEGGGLYLESGALVSGCIIKNNQGYIGGGIYVEEPDVTNPTTYVRLLTSTLVGNTATTTAGGLWFGSNLRANSSAFWLNRANDLNNIAGMLNTDETQIVDNYPLNYCGVESRRVNGVNNIALPVAETEGVRWDHSEAHELSGGSNILYYPITLSSVLGRAGMTYAAYEELRAIYPTLELTDIAGLARMKQAVAETITLAIGTEFTKVQKNNSFIEMGARVLNGTFELKVELQHIMTRLFVTTTEDLPTEAALTLQNNPATDDDAEMYRQMGSSFLNPFHRFGDALEYIVKVRKSDVGDIYKDVRFEVFVGGGTFYPFRDAHGRQGEARANTFVVPEEVTIVGGVDPLANGHAYCQETGGEKTVAGYNLVCATTEAIREGRSRMDRNGNHVMEPWEMEHQTILSGNAVNIDSRTNVYHVITCFSDVDQVGKLPTRWQSENLTGNTLPPLLDAGMNQDEPTRIELLDNLEHESRTSRDKRTIFIDGVTITGGHANDLEDEDESDPFQKLTYFRGGGILVEGNWDATFDDKDDLPEVLGVAKRDIPMVTVNCLFQDNTAGNGGAVYTNGTFYSFSCHYTKNTAQGPNSEIDQKYIPWTAGGAIANNYQLHLWNTLFDNNEAKRGSLAILKVMDSGGGVKSNPVHNADLRQGYGGAISCSETGLVRISNCDFVRNKAVAFPAIYNFFDNNLRAYSGQVYDDYHNYLSNNQDTYVSPIDGKPHNYDYYKTELDDYYYGKGHHFAVNSIFWGNEATSETVSASNWQEFGYYNWIKNAYSQDFNYESAEGWTDGRLPKHIANFGPLLDITTLTFCAYEQGTGREGTVWYDNHDYAKSAKIPSLEELYAGNFVSVIDQYFGYYRNEDPTHTPFAMVSTNPSGTQPLVPFPDVERATSIPFNYNLVLNSENIAADGPYFVQPSISAGADGYMETADWLVARLNPTIDTGWGYLKQQVEQEDPHSPLFTTTFLKGADVNDLTKAVPGDNQYNDLYGEGFYNLHSKNIHERFSAIGFPNLLPIGDETYMLYVREGGVVDRNMRRISTHPKMGVQDVFIDMGIYEYQYVQLVTGGSEIDVIWVAPEEDQQYAPCDGSTWKKATSDLQGAIEQLLLSLNDHDKMIKMRAGTYRPLKMTDGNQKTFFIATPDKNDGVLTPSYRESDMTMVAKSLTIRGGYDNVNTIADDSDGESTRDPDANAVVLEMVREEGNTERQLAHLFIIEDAEMKGNFSNYLKDDNKDFKEYAMPIVFDGLTFVNPYGISGTGSGDHGGADIYYRTQYMTDASSDNFTKDPNRLLKPYNSSIDPLNPKLVPKLIIKDCVFANSGSSATCSAVRIDKGGGHALVVNSLFHSNKGVPIDAVNTRVVNCTFALNGGHVTLKDEAENYYGGTSANFPSALHNSIIWKDDLAAESGERVQWGGVLDTANDNMTHNAYTFWNKGIGAWNEPMGDTTADDKGNFLLSSVNTDVLLGPNFLDPKETLTGVTDAERYQEVLARNFKLNPSAHILNRADKATYVREVPYYASYPDYTQNMVIMPYNQYNPSTNPTGTELEGSTGYARKRFVNPADPATQYWFHSVQRSDATELTDDMLKGTMEDSYVESDLAYKARLLGTGIERGAYECTAAIERVLYVMNGASGEQDGTSWKDAFNIDQLQTAIDVASIYSLLSPMRERAYVFVRATDSKNDVVKVRDGVSVYGSLSSLFREEVERESDGTYLDEKIDAYIHKMQANRSGVATRGVNHNTIQGVVSDNTATHTSGFLLDGFWIDSDPTTATPICLNKDLTVVRNVVITGNSVSGSGQPVVCVDKGLLYNTLIYGNTVSDGTSLVSVGANGYALNNTVVAVASGQTALTAADDSHTKNNISVNGGDTGHMFAPYLSTANVYSLPTYLTSWQPYHYQLHEQSKEINTGTEQSNEWLPTDLGRYVNYGLDRDVLGNPRRLGGLVDNGCFETWKISDNHYVTNVTNADFTTNYGGHQYPHTGSVVYVMEDANLVVNTDGSMPLFGAENPLSPGYVLVKPGGSVYGQGNHLNFGYVAAERSFDNEQYALMSFPFSQNPANAFSTTYNNANDQLTQNQESLTVYTYDGEMRANYDRSANYRNDNPQEGTPQGYYNFKEDNSNCWKPASGEMAATSGWLLKDGAGWTKNVRFTGWGVAEGSYAYSEDGTSKTVVLTQHNSNQVGAANYPMFTQQEHMGWNLKGQPWLVANFVTGGTNPDFAMDVPHLFYSMEGDGSYKKVSGQFYAARSWDASVGLKLGEGFFTQTAIIGEEELLTFKLPVYVGAEAVAPSRKLVALAEDDLLTDYVELNPIEGADDAMPYRAGSDGIKWFAFDERLPQLFLENAVGTPLSFVSAAPVEKEITLGVKTSRTGSWRVMLPDAEAFADYDHVWLTDHRLNRVVDLKEQDYRLIIDKAGYTGDRLTLRIGGHRPEVKQKSGERGYLIYTRLNRLFIEDLLINDHILIYNAGGMLVENCKATSSTYQRDFFPGTYIVRVNNVVKKVLIR